jgi:hypothetical protein
VDGVARPPPAPQLLDRQHDSPPDRIAVEIAVLEQIVGALSRRGAPRRHPTGPAEGLYLAELSY